jgi:hypothetical protein
VSVVQADADLGAADGAIPGAVASVRLSRNRLRRRLNPFRRPKSPSRLSSQNHHQAMVGYTNHLRRWKDMSF